jgi:hypothetical protein
MRSRSAPARWAPLVVVAWAAACASRATTTSPLHDADDATDDVGDPNDGGGPNPDSVVLGDDGDTETGGKTCNGLPDGTLCGASPDICLEPPTCKGGVCDTPRAKPDGFVCKPASDVCHTDGTCKSGSCQPSDVRPESYQWQANDATARCCGGKPVHTTTDSDCNVCGIKCNAANGESCQAVAGRYFCQGCMASAACWSKCCSNSFNPPSCAASDCAGNCDSMYCPAGSHCATGGGVSSDYCSY